MDRRLSLGERVALDFLAFVAQAVARRCPGVTKADDIQKVTADIFVEVAAVIDAHDEEYKVDDEQPLEAAAKEAVERIADRLRFLVDVEGFERVILQAWDGQKVLLTLEHTGRRPRNLLDRMSDQTTSGDVVTLQPPTAKPDDGDTS